MSKYLVVLSEYLHNPSGQLTEINHYPVHSNDPVGEVKKLQSRGRVRVIDLLRHSVVVDTQPSI